MLLKNFFKEVLIQIFVIYMEFIDFVVNWASLRLAIKGDFQDISQMLLNHGTVPY